MQFKHVFNPDNVMTTIPFMHDSSFPKGLYYRVVALRGESIIEIIHLPSGLIMFQQDFTKLGDGFDVQREETRRFNIKLASNLTHTKTY